VFFFERTATLFQHRDPQAASYCKWAARALFRQINPYNDFPNIYYIVKAMGEVEAQLQAGGGRPIPIPELVDIRSRTIMKNEYQKDKHRVDGGAGKRLLSFQTQYHDVGPEPVLTNHRSLYPKHFSFSFESIILCLFAHAGPVPAQHVLCPSRAVGSPYVQSSVYTVPGGYHGSGEQAGTMSHYEYALLRPTLLPTGYRE